MLKEIYFRLKSDTADALREKMDLLLADLAAHGVTVSGLEESEKHTVYENKKEEIMYLTDQEKVYDSLRAGAVMCFPACMKKTAGSLFGRGLCGGKAGGDGLCVSGHGIQATGRGAWEILETDRLLVRETTVQDVDCFYQIYAQPSVTDYTEALFEDIDEEIAYTESYIDTVYAFYGYGMWTVIKKDSREVIGRAGISWREGYRLPELGFVIGVPWQRQGYAFEVCSAILHYAGEELEMTQVQALVQPENARSVRLCEKLGFTKGGETKVDGIRHLVFVKTL